MARPQRNDVDYFPFYCKEGKTMFYLEETYGNDGFAVWVKILRALATSNYHYLDLSDKPNTKFLSSKCKVSEEILLKIVQDLADFGEIDEHLWKEHRIVWSDKFIESIEDAYKNRKNEIIKKAEFILKAESLTGKKLTAPFISSVRNPHTKVEYTKVDESILDDSKVDDSLVATKVATKTIDERENDFMNRLVPFVETYGKKMVREFYEYWTEKSKGGRKMRFEKQTVFDIGRRLGTWKRNEISRSNGKQQATNKHLEHTRNLGAAFAETYGAVLGNGTNGQG